MVDSNRDWRGECTAAAVAAVGCDDDVVAVVADVDGSSKASDAERSDAAPLENNLTPTCACH